jgi:protoporphyrinogen/coproporphyrinogen III oxidase
VSQVLILGGGVSGLSAAYFLSKRGIESTIVEAEPRLGGLIRTDVVNGCQLEAGPDSYIAAKPQVSELAADIPELRNEIIGTNDKDRRIFLVKDGALVAMPRGMVMMVPADMREALRSPLFPDGTKRRFLQERFQKPRERQNDVSIADLVRDHFDDVVLEYITEPLLTGVYGGDVGRLSAASVLPRFLDYERRYGSLVRGVRQERKKQQHSGSLFLSFRSGMQALTDGLARAAGPAMKVVRGEATHVKRQSAKWNVCIGGEWRQAEHLVVALPAHRAAGIFEADRPGLAGELAEIPYSSAITVALGFERKAIAHPLDGFGFLVPRPERRQVAACTWISTKFPMRTPEQYIALRAFIVDTDAKILMAESDPDIFTVVRRELARLMGIEVEPAFHTVHRWPSSMPQYVVGHGERLQRIRGHVGHLNNLFLVGNAYDGVGIPDCVRLARQVADTISASAAEN